MGKFTSELKEFSENTRNIIYAPIKNLLIFAAILLIIFSFFTFNGDIKSISNCYPPRWIMILIAFILIALGFLSERSACKKIKIKKGVLLKLNQVAVNIRMGEIQKLQLTSNLEAVVLPANSSFVDDCITDKNSALGAFMLEHFPDKIQDIIKIITDSAKTSDLSLDKDGTYAVGSAILLPELPSTPFKIIITASTYRKTKLGIKAEPTNICECIKQIFVSTADKKISKLYLPILGSGHGGIDIDSALILLLLAINFYAKQYHHIKNIDIIVAEHDAEMLKNMPCLAFMEKV